MQRKKPNPEDLQDVGPVTESTRVSLTLGTWCGLIAPLLGMAVAATMVYRDFKSEMYELRNTINTSWTLPDQREWAHRMRAENPTIKTPNVDEIRTVIRGR